MATTINAYSVSLGLNVAGLVEGANLSRREISQVVSTLKSLETPAEKVSDKIALLEDAFNAGVISVELYTAGVTRLRDSLKENSAALEEQARLKAKDNALIAHGERLTRSLMTAEEKHAQELRHLKEMYDKTAIGAHTYERAIQDANERLRKANTLQAEILDDPPIVKHAEKVKKSSDELSSTIKGLVTTYIGIEGIRMAAGALQESAERIDKLANTSAQLGESVPNIQSFRYALQQMANIDAEQADQTLVRMTKTLGEARGGSQQAADTFLKLGLDINQLVNMSPTQQFQAIADALANIEDPSQRAAEAVKIFGREGANLLPVFNEGAGAVAAMMAEAESLGLTLSQADAEAVAAMNDELDKIAGQFTLIIDKILVAMMPAISGVLEIFGEQSDAVDWLIWGIGKMADGFALMIALAAEVRQTVYDIGVALYKAAQGDFSFFGKVTEFNKLDAFLDKYEEMQNRQAKGKDRSTISDAEIEQADAAAKAAEAHTKEYEKQVAELEKQITVMERGEVVARQMELAAQGYSDAEIERLETLREQLDQMKRQEQLAQQMKDGLKKIAEEEQKNYENRLKQIDNMKFENPEARKAGSAEAVDFMSKLGREETDKQLKAILEQKALQDKQLAEATRQTELLRKLNDNKPTAIR
jgi:hypothetical protein